MENLSFLLGNESLKKWIEDSKKNHLVIQLPTKFLRLNNKYPRYVKIEKNGSLVSYEPKKKRRAIKRKFSGPIERPIENFLQNFG